MEMLRVEDVDVRLSAQASGEIARQNIVRVVTRTEASPWIPTAAPHTNLGDLDVLEATMGHPRTSGVDGDDARPMPMAQQRARQGVRAPSAPSTLRWVDIRDEPNTPSMLPHDRWFKNGSDRTRICRTRTARRLSSRGVEPRILGCGRSAARGLVHLEE